MKPSVPHQVQHSFLDRLRTLVPFGLGVTKPKHVRDMFRVLWINRDNLPYAWKVITRGVCDGCALGVAGLHDWTISGIHLCMTRLNLLRLNTMPAIDPSALEDLEQLKKRLADEAARRPLHPGSASAEFNRHKLHSALDWDNTQLRHLGRLSHPMIRHRGDRGFKRITWDEALDVLGARLRRTDPKRLAFFVTARGVTNEVYYMAQKTARFLGTNHVDNAARLCHAPSTGAMKHALGVAASTCSYKDWYGTDLIVFFGANPANDQPLTTKYLHEAKKLGTRVVMVNPYLEPGMKQYWVPSTPSSALFGTRITDYWYPVSQGGDIAFIYGVLKVLVAKGGINKEFIEQHTAQWEELESRIAQYTFAELESQAGLPQASMEAFADLLMTAHNAVFVWSMGITQHAYGGDAVSMVLNLGLARGYVGREKTGLVPIRGHSSVQGGAEMGCYATALPGGVPVTEENCRKLGEHYGFPIPTWPGYNSVEMVQAAGRGELDVLYCLGGNFLRTLPNPADVVDALSRVPLRVYQDILVNDQMLMEPNETVLLLPAKTRYEQDDGGTETTTERRILFSPELPRELGEVRAEWKILHQVAAATYPDRAYLLGPADGWALRTEIAHVVPFYDGVQHLKKIGDAIQYGGPRLCDNGQFPTTDGKAHFKAISLPPQDAPGLISKIEMRPGNNDTNSTASDDAKESHVANSQAPKQPQQVPVATPTARRTFMVSTRRGKQFNSLVYAEIDPLNGAPRDAVLMHDTDAAALGLSNGQQVVLKNAVGRYAGRVFLAPIAPGNLQVHWPEGNVILASDVTDPVGGVPDYNARVEVEPI